jgi:hypothetical protein
MKWNLAKIISIVRDVQGVENVTALNDFGDYTTKSVYVEVGGTEEHLWVRGFVTSEGGLNGVTDDVEVELVEVTTGYSDGDMPNDPILMVVHAKIRAALSVAGYKTVISLEPYF